MPFRYRDRATCHALPDRNIQSLILYFSFRERLFRNRHRLEVSSGELRKVLKRDPVSRPGIRQYAERKKAEGKNSWIILNNVRNKLIHRIFAAVKRGNEYSVDYFNELQKKAV
ncbi:MAG: hypothetical protein LBK58_00345 [Prevotellaceae bacterium]|jgi:hypothetical protein|nr:hypothetical protein [Prevotellaceae bacterium]